MLLLLRFCFPRVLSSLGRPHKLWNAQTASVWRLVPFSFPPALAWLLEAVSMMGTNGKACHWHAVTPAKGCPKTKHVASQGAGVDHGRNKQQGTLWLQVVSRTLLGCPGRSCSCADEAQYGQKVSGPQCDPTDSCCGGGGGVFCTPWLCAVCAGQYSPCVFRPLAFPWEQPQRHAERE